MTENKKNLIHYIWHTSLFRHVLLVISITAVAIPGYDLLTVYPAFSGLLKETIEENAAHTAKHLANTLVEISENDGAFSKQGFNQSDWDALEFNARDFGLWKMRVFAPNGEIIYSTKPSEIGNINNKPYFADIVAKGGNVSKLERKQAQTMEGEALPLDVVEVYVPIMDGKQFLGAFEVYYDITSEYGALTKLQYQSGTILVIIVSIIVVLIWFLIVKAARERIELAKTRSQLSTQEKLFRDVIGSANSGIVVTDERQHITIVNAAFCEMTGYDDQEIIGKSPDILQSDQHEASYFQEIWGSVRQNGSWQGEIWNKNKEGDVYPGLLTISTIEDDQGVITHYVGIFHDISEQKASEQHYQDMAHHDGLTKLANRTLFLQLLDQAKREAAISKQPLAILFLDLDGFKNINDTAGHDAGDAMLIAVANRLRENVRKNDVIARLGGDEFILILANIDQKAIIQRVAENLITSINRPAMHEGKDISVGASIGAICYLPGDMTSNEELINQADDAMYEAKQSGKNCVVIRCDTPC